MDADGQHPVGSTLSCIRAVQDGADLCAGTRHNEQGSVADDWPLWRRAVSHGATALAWGAVPPARNVSDPMSGMFAVRRDVVEAVRDQLRPAGYKIMLELLARCPLDRVEERGYTFKERSAGGSNLGAQEYVDYVRHLARLSVPSRQSADQEVAGRVPHRD
jgi:dolichol-phosphate mannosyltransferase